MKIEYLACERHKIKNQLIGAEFGRFIYRCPECFKEVMEYLKKERKENENEKE